MADARQAKDIRVHGAVQTDNPVHGGIIPPHGGTGAGGTGPVHGSTNISQTFSLNFQTATYSTAFTFTRSGTKLEALSGGVVTSFATDTLGLFAGTGAFLRAGTTALLPNSSTPGGSGWINTNLTVTAGQSDPAGGTGATKLAATTGTAAFTQLSANIGGLVAAGTYTLELIFKPGTANYGWISLSDGTNQWRVHFDAAGSAISAIITNSGSPAVLVSSSVTNISNGFRLCRLVFTQFSTANHAVYVGPADSFSDNSVVTAGHDIDVYNINIYTTANAPIVRTSGGGVAIGADTLTVSFPTGSYTALFTFDDGSTQSRAVNSVAGVMTLPTFPTLNRPLVRSVVVS